MLSRLTAKQAEFVERFHDRGDLHGSYMNATKAAAAAGFAWPDKQGPRLLTFPAVKAEVERRLDAYVAEMRAARKARLLETWAAIYPAATLARYLADLEREEKAARRRPRRARI